MLKKKLIVLMVAIFTCMAVLVSQPQAMKPGQGGVKPPEQPGNQNLQEELKEMRENIAAHGWHYTVGPNPAMYHSLDELCGFKAFMDTPSSKDHWAGGPKAPAMPQLESTLPSSYVGYASSIKNQGQCGSCWAFSTIAGLEAAVLKETGAPQITVTSSSVTPSGSSPDLSEQHLVSCNAYGWGCNGGSFAYDMLDPSQSGSGHYPGAMPESCFPYTESDSNCSFCSNPTYTPVVDWAYVGTSSSVPSTEAIKQAIYTYGGVSAAVYADTSFQYYTGGVFEDNSSGSVNHGIILCGWDDSLGPNGAWLLKNSWGTGWGIDGFMWIAYGNVQVGYAACWVTSNAAPSVTYSISGTILDSSYSAVSGATVTLSGDSSGSATTDASGNYSFSNLNSGSYTVTPSKTGCSFTPTSRNVSITAADVTGQNFTASCSTSTYSISGTVSGDVTSGVAITLSGDASASTTTDGSGNYTFSGLADGSYTITPSKSGYTFSPSSINVTISGANQSGENFTSSAIPAGCNALTASYDSTYGCPAATTVGQSVNTSTLLNCTGASGESNAPNTIDGCADGDSGTCHSDESIESISIATTDGSSCLAPGQEVTVTVGTYCYGTADYVTLFYATNASSVTWTKVGSTQEASGGGSQNFTWTFTLSGTSDTMQAVRAQMVYNADPGTNSCYSGSYNDRDDLAFMTGSGTPTYSISGTVSGDTASGVTMTLTGDASASTTTDSSGNYTFSGLADGSYTVTPSESGYTFSPTSTNVTISGANQTGKNFTASAVTYSISGTVSGDTASGVTMNLTGDASASTTTDSSGNYTFSGLANGSYTITPSKSGYTFSPTSINVTLSGANQTGKNFTASAVTYSISGTVSGDTASGVTMTLSGAASASTTTDSSGNYTFSGLADGSYTITPSKSGYTFSPTSINVTLSGANQTGNNFTATSSSCTLTCTASASPTSGTAPLDVTFTATATPSNCTGTPTYDWNFGDGSAHSSAQNPSHTYASAGTYNWTMTATVGTTTCTKSGTVTVTTPCTLTCTASAAPTSGTAPLPVSFTATATLSGCTGTPTYDWNFGDGSAHSSVQNPSHTYASAGTYNWTMKTSVDGKTCTKSGSITVTIPCTLTVTSPTVASVWSVGATCQKTITWMSGQCGNLVKIDLYRDGGLVRTIADSAPNTGSYSYLSPQDLPAGTGYSVRVQDLTSGVYADSASFAMVVPATVTSIKKGHAPGIPATWRIKIQGANFDPNCLVYIGDDTAPYSNVKWKNSGKIILKKGRKLKAKFQKGVCTAIRIVNPDGGEVCTGYERGKGGGVCTP